MTGRDRVEAAFSSGGAAQFGAVIPYETIYIRDKWDDLTARPWWALFDPDIQAQLEWRREVAQSIGHDWFQITGSKPAEQRAKQRLETQGEEAFLVDDADGARRQLSRPQVSGVGTSVAETRHVDHLPESVEQIDQLIRIPASDPTALAGEDDLPQAVLADYGRDLFPVAHAHSPLWECYSLWGFEGMMVMIAQRPELVKRACERVMAKVVWQVRRHAAMGAKGVWIEECLTDQVSPNAYSSLCLPGLRGVTDAIRAAGMKSIHYFCGEPAGKWDLLLDSGADALSLEETKKGFVVDLAEVAEIVRGRMALLGNLDVYAVLQRGSEDDLRRALTQQIAAGRANSSRFIASLGSPVTPDTPPRRVRLYCEMAREMSVV